MGGTRMQRLFLRRPLWFTAVRICLYLIYSLRGLLGVAKCGTTSGYRAGCHCKDCRRAHSAANRVWARLNRDKVTAGNYRWAQRNPDKRAAICRRWRNGRSPGAERLRLKSAVRNRVAAALRRFGKKACTHLLLGCSVAEFRRHIESLFLPGMTWANRHLWHIDHETPICRFDLSTLAGQQAAFHYTNTQPLWAVDNLRKGAKLPDLAHV